MLKLVKLISLLIGSYGSIVSQAFRFVAMYTRSLHNIVLQYFGHLLYCYCSDTIMYTLDFFLFLQSPDRTILNEIQLLFFLE